MNISQNIKALRLKKRITQKELSIATGIRHHNIGAYEEGRAEPTINTLCKLSDYFNVSLDVLIKGNLSITIEQ